MRLLDQRWIETISLKNRQNFCFLISRASMCMGKTFFAICFLLIIITWRDCTHFSMNVGLILICVLELFDSVIYFFYCHYFRQSKFLLSKKINKNLSRPDRCVKRFVLLSSIVHYSWPLASMGDRFSQLFMNWNGFVLLISMFK